MTPIARETVTAKLLAVTFETVGAIGAVNTEALDDALWPPNVAVNCTVYAVASVTGVKDEFDTVIVSPVIGTWYVVPAVV